MPAVPQREDVPVATAPRAALAVPATGPAPLVAALGNRGTARLARRPQRSPGGRAARPQPASLARTAAVGEGTGPVAARCSCGGVMTSGGECTTCLARRLASEGRPAEATGAALLRQAIRERADQQLVQRVGWKDIPLIGKTLWCQMEMGHVYQLKAECMKEFKEVCSGDMLDPACTNFCRRPLLKRDERHFWERWFGLEPDPNRVVPMAEPGSSGDISGCILDCMKSKDPEAMGSFLDVCATNAFSAMGD